MAAKKKTVKKTTTKKTNSTDNKIDKLLENGVQLQKISLNLIKSNNDLTKRIGNLITLFEEASKNVGKVELSDKNVGRLTSKVEELVEENKDLAKGLVLLERYVRGKTAYEPTSLQHKDLPKF